MKAVILLLISLLTVGCNNAENNTPNAGRVDEMPTIESPASSSGPEGSSGDPLWDLLTADAVAQITIDAVVSDAPFTNAHPPKLQMTVGAIVRGEFSVRQIEAFWLPPPHDIDTGGEDNPDLIAWKQTAFPPPKVGTQWRFSQHLIASILIPAIYLSCLRADVGERAKQPTVGTF